jgi:hypothetical protein
MRRDDERPVGSARWSTDGKSILGTVSDDQKEYLVRIRADGSGVDRVPSTLPVISAFSAGPDGGLAVLGTMPTQPAEIFAVDASGTRQLSHQNDWITGIALSTTEAVSARSDDGNEVHGILRRPAGAPLNARLPLIIRPHGGPAGQDAFGFDFEKELLPVFRRNCLACHNQTKAKADLVLETPQTILKGGESGPAVVPANGSESLLLKLASHQDKPVMPPKENKVNASDLTSEQLVQRCAGLNLLRIRQLFAEAVRNGKRVTDFYGAWDKACALAGCPDRIPHDFRRTMARNYRRSGEAESVIMRIGGWRTRSVFERYNVVNEDDLRRAAERVTDRNGAKTGQIVSLPDQRKS